MTDEEAIAILMLLLQRDELWERRRLIHPCPRCSYETDSERCASCGFQKSEGTHEQ